MEDSALWTSFVYLSFLSIGAACVYSCYSMLRNINSRVMGLIEETAVTSAGVSGLSYQGVDGQSLQDTETVFQ